jgi:predicted AAA+ superfamily ATPase
MWINRDISRKIIQNNDVIQVLRGPRQCGKTSLILNLDQSFHEVSLDDSSLRELAQNDPELFLKQFDGKKIFIDEAQYAPALFPALKRKADLYKRDSKNPKKTIIRLTGSNQILMDKNIKESLAGRASYFDLNTLSVNEIIHFQDQSIQSIIYKGGWPELYIDKNKDTKKFLDDYINSYIEKDIVLSAGIQKSREFLKFIKLLAGRTGTLVDFSNLSKDIGVDSKTIKDWISVLEKMHIIYLLPPYFTNLSKRLTKTPKIYFLDTGLACRLQGWTSQEPILVSPQQGGLFETLVFAEIYKLIQNFQLGWQIYLWRTKEKEEIDFLIQMNPTKFLFIESKVSAQPSFQFSISNEIKKVLGSKIPFWICHQEGDQILNNNVPISLLSEALLKFEKEN